MVQHIVAVTATSNSSGNTQDLWIEFGGMTAGTVKLKRVRCGFGSGNQNAGIDNNFIVQIYRYTTTTGGSPLTLTFSPAGGQGTGTVGNTPVVGGAFLGNIWTARNPNVGTATPAGLSAKVKNGTTALALGTTTVQAVDEIAPNGRALYEWLARDDDDMIISQSAGFIGIVLQSQTASQVFTITTDWII